MPRVPTRRVPVLSSRMFPLLLLGTVLLSPLASCQSADREAAQVSLAQGDSAMNRLAYGEAAERYGEATALAPDFAEAYSRQGLALWAAQQFEAAIPVLDRAIELDPDNANAYYYRGSSHLALDRFEESVGDLKAATDLGSLDPEDGRRAHHLRAVAFMNLERYEDAIAAVSSAIEMQPDNAFYYIERARLYDFTGQTDAAIADYEAFLSRDDEGSLADEARQRLAGLRGEVSPEPAASDSTRQ